MTNDLAIETAGLVKHFGDTRAVDGLNTAAAEVEQVIGRSFRSRD